MKTLNFKAVIVDDEDDAREMVSIFLEQMFPTVEIIGQMDSVNSAAHAIYKLEPDILFLDIEMSDGTGFDLLTRLAHQPDIVIFITAFDNYAIKAIKASAFDYILKPIDAEEFRQTMNLALRRLEQKRFSSSFGGAMAAMQIDTGKIGLPVLNGVNYVDVDTILYCEADDNYTVVHFTNFTKTLVSRTLSHFENDLRKYNFFRSHNKYLVNMKYISSYTKGKDGGFITLVNRVELKVALRKKTDLLKTLSHVE